MSSVRMCDRCGNIFSELKDGWQTYRAVTVKRNPENGTTYQVEVSMDSCPDCALNALVNPIEPRIKTTALPAPKDVTPPVTEKVTESV